MDELAAAAPWVARDGEAAQGGQLRGQVPHGVRRQPVVLQAQGSQRVQGAVLQYRGSKQCH